MTVGPILQLRLVQHSTTYEMRFLCTLYIIVENDSVHNVMSPLSCCLHILFLTVHLLATPSCSKGSVPRSHITSALHRSSRASRTIWFRRSTRSHITLPQEPLRIKSSQLPRDTVHDTPVVEHDQITFLPVMRVNVLWFINLLLEAVAYPSHLV